MSWSSSASLRHTASTPRSRMSNTHSRSFGIESTPSTAWRRDACWDASLWPAGSGAVRRVPPQAAHCAAATRAMAAAAYLAHTPDLAWPRAFWPAPSWRRSRGLLSSCGPDPESASLRRSASASASQRPSQRKYRVGSPPSPPQRGAAPWHRAPPAARSEASTGARTPDSPAPPRATDASAAPAR
eukprot:scaffold1172_cov247-Pinguiococcus_pyrenoidosus.AAC.16